MALSWTRVLARRLRRQHLAMRAPRGAAVEVARDVAGLHAQLMGSAELALWARVEGLERDAVASALWEERTLVKTWAMRGTLHLLAADELALYVAAQGALKPRHETGAWLRAFGLTREEAGAMLDAIPEALGGEPLTREQLAAAVEERTGVPGLADRLRGGFGDLLKPAAFRGDLCFAPSDGQAVRFTRPDAWLGAPLERPDPGAAIRELTRRWLRAYGPSTPAALARWFGSPSVPQARRWLEGLGDEAVTVDVEGTPAWDLADVDHPAEEPAGVRLLPAFDPFVVGTPREEDAAIARERRPAVYRPQGWLSPVVLVDGRMAGTWRHAIRGSRVVVTVEPFAGAPPPVEAEAQALAAFLGCELELAA